ncbi:26S proteasome regulatory subunit RPN1 [Nosema granulosis]|uniref:26S proteasome regulatory subunit RPN1 n=1 Tax=Nosema granulosis TaxID=83296 RepID=A0A9P6L0V5_9MICR|nr:26S proteasome regulatory subunit RPN1 [Nosema granulosis]
MENENLNMILERLKETDEGVQEAALNMLIDLIKQSHSNNTLNFQHFSDKKAEMIEIANRNSTIQKRMYDVISAISIIGDDEDILKYRQMGDVIPLSEWGHLYVKKLVGCIVDSKNEKNKEIVEKCKEFLFKNNLEFEAIDFILEIGGSFEEYVQPHNYKRVIQYLEEMQSFYELDLSGIYKKMGDHARFVAKEKDRTKVVEYARGIQEKQARRQVLYMLARMGIYYESEDPEERHILRNSHTPEIYQEVIKALELDLVKKNTKYSKFEKDLHKPIHQASFSPITITNGLIHIGFENDPIFFPVHENENESLLQNVDYQAILNSDIPELVTVLGSVGCLELWHPEKVLELLQEHIFSEGVSSKKTGSLLALALASSKIHDDSFLGFLTDNLNSGEKVHVLPTLLGIQSMFAGSCDESLRSLLTPLLFSEVPEIGFFTSFVLGSIFAGSADEELTFMLNNDADHANYFYKFQILGLALLFFKRSDLPTISTSLHASILVRAFQHVATGDPQIVENILADSFTGDTDALLESLAILGISIIGMKDVEMVSRIVTSSLLLESPHLKSVLPLAYSLLYPSNPQSQILDVLEKSLNSGDSISTIYALGIIGAGTQNGRIQKALDQQLAYFYKDPKASSVLKISQGLLNLGKGLMSLSPFFYEKSFLCPKSFIGLFATTLLFLESPSEDFYLFYLLVQSCTPKTIYTEKKINIRIGNPVNTVGVVGDPRRITSMQTHTTPVILGSNERAEIDEEAYTTFIEDVVVLKQV